MPEAVRFESLNKGQISSDVYNALREKILSCELVPGQRLAVDTIAQQLGVSRILPSRRRWVSFPPKA